MQTFRIFNRGRETVRVGEHVFPPHKEVAITLWRGGREYHDIRADQRLVEIRGGRTPRVYEPKTTHRINLCYDYDVRGRRGGFSYQDVIDKLSAPILACLDNEGGMVERPVPNAVNVRFFNQRRIQERGGDPVSSVWDVFVSHGVADKNYWIARKVDRFLAVFACGPAWTERMVAGGVPRERIYEVGFLKLDPIFQGAIERTPSERPRILWASTHRGRPAQSSYPACLRKIKELPQEWEASISTHPANNQGHTATMQPLVDADVVIADSGSTIYEAWALGKPVVFPDWLTSVGTQKNRPGSLEARIYEEGIGRHARSMDHLVKLCEDALRDGMTEQEVEFIDRCCPPKTRGRAGELAANALRELAERKEREGAA